MKSEAVRVSSGGGIVLGGRVVCDGFFAGVSIRAQTHVHDDHMQGFNSSKGLQTIVMSEPTRALLIEQYDADLPYRDNVCCVPTGQLYEVDRVAVQLLPSGHMLGAVQVIVTMPDGTRLGYSGDFNWPLEEVMAVDVLVVDSTNGSPNQQLKYKRDVVDELFVSVLAERLQNGGIHIKAYRGTLERALELICAATNVPIVARQRLCREIQVYRSFGYHIGPVLPLDSADGQHALTSGQYIRLYDRHEGDIYGLTIGTGILLDRYLCPTDEPLVQHSSHVFRIAMSCHASFEETIQYVEATRASYVVTDNSRGGNAVELAREIRARLRIDAEPSGSPIDPRWGQ